MLCCRTSGGVSVISFTVVIGVPVGIASASLWPSWEEIKGKFKTNNLTDEQIKKYKKHGSELIDGDKSMHAHKVL